MNGFADVSVMEMEEVNGGDFYGQVMTAVSVVYGAISAGLTSVASSMPPSPLRTAVYVSAAVYAGVSAGAAVLASR
jgi:hypothetical protein